MSKLAQKRLNWQRCLNWMSKLATKTPRKTQKNSNQLKNKRIINIKISAKGGPVFTFSVPGGEARPLAPSVTPLPTCQTLCHYLKITDFNFSKPKFSLKLLKAFEILNVWYF